MSDIPNDGGPAFPVGSIGNAYMDGMSLRDWFAAHAIVTDKLSATIAEELMGEKTPVWTTETEMARVVWWVQVEARLRYIKADAMLAARAIGGAP